ncbi:MAG: hypothetical protein SNH27_15545 [Rikenellaceae bacterium]
MSGVLEDDPQKQVKSKSTKSTTGLRSVSVADSSYPNQSGAKPK